MNTRYGGVPVTRSDLEPSDALIKDRSIDQREVRRLAQNMKRTAPFNELLIVLDPKIGSTGQRRLSFGHFFGTARDSRGS